MLWAVSIFLLLLGVAALVLALRGRRVGNDPHCRKCCFDLSGTPHAHTDHATDDVPRCPECGRQLTNPDDIVIGTRRRRPALAATGTLLSLLAVAGISLHVASNPAWNSAKPTWLLMLEATRLRGDVRDNAATELIDRHFGASPLSNAQLSALVGPALAVQADSARPWESSFQWWALLDSAFGAGVVSEEQTAAYVRNAFGNLVWEPPHTALADHEWLPRFAERYPLPEKPPRLAPSVPVRLAMYLERFEVDGAELPLAVPGREHSRRVFCRTYEASAVPLRALKLSSRSGRSSGEASSPGPSHLFPEPVFAPGPHSLATEWRIDAYLIEPQSANHTPAIPAGPAAASWTVRLEQTITAAKSVEALLRDVSTSGPFDELLQSSNDPPMSAPRLDVGTSLTLGDGPSPPGSLDVTSSHAHGGPTAAFQIHGSIGRDEPRTSPEWIVGTLSLRARGTRWPLGRNVFEPADPRFEPARIILPPDQTTTFIDSLNGYIDSLPAGLAAADLVITPDPTHAAQIGANGEFWADEIVIRDVGLNWLADALRRAREDEPTPPAPQGVSESSE